MGARQRPGGGRGGGRDRVLSCRPGALCIWCNMVNNCALWISMVQIVCLGHNFGLSRTKRIFEKNIVTI